MPFRISWEPSGLVRHFSGEISANDVRSAIQLDCSASAIDGVTYVVNHFDENATAAFTVDDLETFAPMYDAAALNNPLLVVCVTNCDQTLELLQAWAALLPYPMRTYPTLAAAREDLAQLAGGNHRYGRHRHASGLAHA